MQFLLQKGMYMYIQENVLIKKQTAIEQVLINDIPLNRQNN